MPHQFGLNNNTLMVVGALAVSGGSDSGKKIERNKKLITIKALNRAFNYPSSAVAACGSTAAVAVIVKLAPNLHWRGRVQCGDTRSIVGCAHRGEVIEPRATAAGWPKYLSLTESRRGEVTKINSFINF